MALPDQAIQDTDFPDDQSQTSFAVSLVDDTKDNQLQLPALLDISGGATSFECPFCWTIQSFRKESAWRKHAFTDLRPYVCTWERCDVKIFADRRDWFEHELQCHRQRWPCQFACKSEFRNSSTYEAHLRQVHLPIVSNAQLEAIAQASARPVSAILASDCPFCNEWHTSLRSANPGLDAECISVTPVQFRHHVGHHLQSLALFAIPRGYLERDELGADSAAVSEVAAAGSHTGSDEEILRQSLMPADDLPLNVAEGRAIDLPHCAQILRKASMGTKTTLQHYITHILPRLDIEDVRYVRSMVSVSSILRPFSLSDSFKFLSEAVMLGPWSSDALCLRKWLTVSQHSRYWWIFLSRFLIGRSADAYDRINACLRTFDASLISIIERAFVGTACPAWLTRSLVYLVQNGQTSDSTDVPDLRASIEQLESTFTNTSCDELSLEATMKWLLTLSNRHLRDLVRVYPRLTGGKPLANSLDTFFTGSQVSLPSLTSVNQSLTLVAKSKALAAPISTFSTGIRYMIQYILDGAVDCAYRDTRLIALLVDKVSKLHKTPTISEGSVGPYEVLLVIVLQLHWDDDQLRATRKTVANVSSSSLSNVVANVLDVDIQVFCASLLQPGLTSAPFDPDIDQRAEAGKPERKEVVRLALDFEWTLETSSSAIRGVNGCLWLRSWIEEDGTIEADCMLSIDYDPYVDENISRWRHLKTKLEDVFGSYGVRHYRIDLQVLPDGPDRQSGDPGERLHGRHRAGNLFEGVDIAFPSRNLQAKKIWRAWQSYLLRRTIAHRAQQRNRAACDHDAKIDDVVAVSRKFTKAQPYWGRLMVEIREARVEALIKKWTSEDDEDEFSSMKQPWYERLSAFPLFVQAPEILEKVLAELDWEVLDPNTPLLTKDETAKDLYWLIEGEIFVSPQPPWKLQQTGAGLLNAVCGKPHPFYVAADDFSFIVRLRQRDWTRALMSLPHLETYIEDYGVPMPFYLQRHGPDFLNIQAAEFRLWTQLDSCEEPGQRRHVAKQWGNLTDTFTAGGIWDLTAYYSSVLCLAARTGDWNLLIIFVNLGAKVDREAQGRTLQAIALQNGQSHFAAMTQEQFLGGRIQKSSRPRAPQVLVSGWESS